MLDENLDIGCKIVAFSDVIAALMEDRPYRKSLPIETAFEIIKDRIAAKISLDMFATIMQHENEINDIVHKSQQNVLREYTPDAWS